MSRTFRASSVVWLLVVLAILLWSARADVPRLTGGVKGDEATYIAMAFSLAKDGDLKYRTEDYARFRALYGTGPEGIFLKRGYDLEPRVQTTWPVLSLEKVAIPSTESLEFGKPFAYSVLAAPFAAVFGLGGLLGLNLLLLTACVWCAIRFAQARIGLGAGALVGSGFVLASVSPVYGVWLTPEIFNFTLVFVAYFLILYKVVAPNARAFWRRPALEWAAAFLLGVATYSKVSNLLLIGPLLVILIRERRWRHLAISVALFAAGSVGLFAANAWVSGEANFQGGDRRYYVTHFPYDGSGTTFETTGNVMATNEANDENILAPAYVAQHLPYNVWYFFVGRDAGLLPYYFPGLCIAILWLVRWRTWAVWQVATAVVCAGSALGLLLLAPESWNGGGGPVGNRYFLAIYPTMLFLLPPGVTLIPAVAIWVVGTTFVGPILSSPFTASRLVWVNPERWPLRLLPIELTIIEQLPVRLNLLRARVEVSKDPQVFLYYMDSNTYFQEAEGFWVAPGTADIIIRTERPLTRLDLRVSSSVPNDVRLSIGGRSHHITLAAGQESLVQFRPEPGVYAYQSYQIVLSIETANGFYPQQLNPNARDVRHLGAFIKPSYEVK